MAYFHYNRIKLFYLTLILSFLLSYGNAQGAKKENHVDPIFQNIAQEIKHADTYYWFGMAESGNLAAFNKSYHHLLRATDLTLESISENYLLNQDDKIKSKIKSSIEKINSDFQKISEYDFDNFRKTINSLNKFLDNENSNNPRDATKFLSDYLLKINSSLHDIEEQIGIAIDTLYGVFPLVRFLTGYYFLSPNNPSTYEFLDDSDIMASTAAGISLIETIKNHWKNIPQHDVVFNGVHNNSSGTLQKPTLENELLYLFNDDPKFYVHNQFEISSILNSTEFENFQKNNLTHEIVNQIMSELKIPRLLVATVSEKDIHEKNYFYQAEARLYSPGKYPEYTLSVMGFSRDSKEEFSRGLIAQIILLLLAITISFYICFIKYNKKKDFSFLTLLFVLLFFAIGYVLPWLTLPGLQLIAPIPETLAKISWWWCFLAGIALFFLPLVIGSIAIFKLPWLNVNSFPKSFPIFLSIALGSSSYLVVPIFLYLETLPAILTILLIALATISISALTVMILNFSHTHGNFLPGKYYFGVIFIFSGSLGLVSLHLGFNYLFFVNILYVSSIFIWTNHKKNILKKLPLTAWVRLEEDLQEITSDELTKLQQNTIKPTYQEPAGFRDRYNKIFSFPSQEASYLSITGSGGVGKTRYVEELLRDLMGNFPNNEVLIMHSECIESGYGKVATPLEPFRLAMQSVLGSNLFTTQDDQGLVHDELTGTMLRNAADLLPGGGLVFAAIDNLTQSKPNSEIELFKHISSAITNLSEENCKWIILSIDDAQWLDESSLKLLEFLLLEFRNESLNNIVVIITSRTDEGDSTEAIEIMNKATSENVLLSFDNVDLISTIFQKSLNLHRTTTQQIISYLNNNQNSFYNNLFGVLECIRALIDGKYLQRSPDGKFVLSGSIDKIPLPQSSKNRFIELTQDLPLDARKALECACFIGRKFKVSFLAKALRWDKLELLYLLKRIEEEHGIIKDIWEEDDWYAFSSSFFVKGFRETLSKRHYKADIYNLKPQIIREYHQKIASALEDDFKTNQGVIFELAEHSFEAGQGFAERAVEYCQVAAQKAVDSFAFEKSERFCEMAIECLINKSTTERTTLKKDIIDLACMKLDCMSQIGRNTHNPVDFADKWLNWLVTEKEDDYSNGYLSLLIRLSLAHYNNSNYDEGEKVADEVMEKSKNSDYFQAKALHYKAICIDKKQINNKEHVIVLLEKAEKTIKNDAKKEIGKETNCRAVLAQVLDSIANIRNRKWDHALKRRNSLSENEFTLSYKRIEEYYLQSKVVKESINDQYGLAITLGGLGRLCLGHYRYENENSKNNPLKKVNEAKDYFKESMNYSSKIGDHKGQILRHSDLGKCALILNNIKEARRHYDNSLALATCCDDKRSQVFASVGLLESYSLESPPDQAELNNISSTLLQICQELSNTNNFPHFLKTEITRILKLTKNVFSNEVWHKELSKLTIKK